MLKLMKKAYTSENSSMFADGVKQSRSSIIWKWRENGPVLCILCRWETLMMMKRMLKMKRMLTIKIDCASFCSEPASSYDVTFALHHKDKSTITIASHGERKPSIFLDITVRVNWEWFKNTHIFVPHVLQHPQLSVRSLCVYCWLQVKWFLPQEIINKKLYIRNYTQEIVHKKLHTRNYTQEIVHNKLYTRNYTLIASSLLQYIATIVAFSFPDLLIHN